MPTKNLAISTDTGLTVYAIIRDNSGNVYDGSSLVTFNAANWTSYAQSLTEQGATGYYNLTFPSLSNGIYSVTYYSQSGGSAAITDEKIQADFVNIADEVATPGSDTGHIPAQYTTQLGLIQTAISNALTNPRPNYRVGEVSYNHGDYLKILFEQQDKLVKIIQEIPFEGIDTQQDAINDFGEDLNDYIHEPRL